MTDPIPHPEPKVQSPLFSVRLVAALTLLSRVLGMIRDMAIAGLFGLSAVGDAFLFAFRVPNLARKLFGEGALSAAFLPAFTRELELQRTTGRASAWELANAVLVTMTVVLAGLALLADLVLGAIAWSAPEDGRLRLILGLTAVMLPYAVLICLAAQLTAMLHALGQFTWPALVPVAMNLVQIVAAWGIVPRIAGERTSQAYLLCGFVLLAGVVQLVLQVPPLLRLGYGGHWNWQSASAGLRDVAWSMLPVTLGLSITQINTLLDSVIATVFSQPPGGGPMPLPGNPAYPMSAGAVSALYYGERMYQFPLGVFGIALSTVLFPRMSQHVARGDLPSLKDDLALGLRLVLSIGLPATAGLILIAAPITRVLFQSGEFTEADASRTAAMIATYGAGVWAYCAIPVLYRSFYALGDRRTPVKIGLLAVAIDLVLNLTLIWPLGERGLACSTVVSAAVQVAVLLWALQQHLGPLDWKGTAVAGAKSLAAVGAMSAGCAALLWIMPQGNSRAWEATRVSSVVALAGGLYLALARVVGLNDVWRLIRGAK